MNNQPKIKRANRYRRHRRVRAKIRGNKTAPRFCVFKSNRYIYSQLIDDDTHRVLTAASEKNLGENPVKAKGKIKIAYEVGKKLAILAREINIKKAVFDKGGYKYHGRVKALADGARDGGLLL